MKGTKQKLKQLQSYITSLNSVTVAVSGGVDSMTLAYVANQCLGEKAKIVHSISPAVPPKDTARIKRFAKKYGWNILFIKSGEMDNQHYKSNPVNRCYYCKTCLYSKLVELKHGTVISGTNLDDLDDYRPGLIAAKEKNVCHPFVEVGIDKNAIRNISLYLGLPKLSRLPASPCLASRIETGIPIKSDNLLLVNEVEQKLKKLTKLTKIEILRCRIKDKLICIEIDAVNFDSLTSEDILNINNKATKILSSYFIDLPITISTYKKGSAFLRPENV